MLLVGAGLLLRTFLRVQAVDLGFAPSQALAMRVNTSGDMDGKARHVLLQEIAPPHPRTLPASSRRR